jgi:hypothetical protein
VREVHLHLVPRLRMGLLSLYAFMEWTEIILPSPYELFLAAVIIFEKADLPGIYTIMGTVYR